jgi:L-amino acid N-acyltransferase YncA
MIEVGAMLPEHWGDVRAIYLQGIATGDATFERAAPDWDAWDRGHLRCCRLVAQQARGRGVGGLPLQALVEESERNGIWTLQGSIFPENRASLDLHRKAGFRVVGTRERIGSMEGKWRDTVLVERRSASVGT